MEEYYSADTQAVVAGQSNNVFSSEKELREKALMYAVQAFASDPQLDIVAMAEAFLDHLRGDAK